jgi:hypothetical protein
MTTVDEPTMNGFVWSPAPPFVPTQPGENGYCLRDALCPLFDWEISSDEWLRFRNAPAGRDIPRLAEHLGLTVFEIHKEWNDLIGRIAHPGIVAFDFPAYQMSHVVYVHDLRWLFHHWSSDGRPHLATAERQLWWPGWPLGPEYMARGPELGAVLVDERQAPRPRVIY